MPIKSIKQTERLIITHQHSNPQIVILGTVGDSAGVITIDFGDYIFVGMPVILAIYPEGVATGKTAQPICYHQEWIIDGTDTRLYTGMKVFSNGLGTAIHWAVQGIVKK
jgi:hypothetical protein